MIVWLYSLAKIGTRERKYEGWWISYFIFNNYPAFGDSFAGEAFGEAFD